MELEGTIKLVIVRAIMDLVEPYNKVNLVYLD